MAPNLGEQAAQLREHIKEQEARLKELEGKLARSDDASSVSPAESVRMVVMGPPGAGTCLRVDSVRRIPVM